jgi:hypothetical protein
MTEATRTTDFNLQLKVVNHQQPRGGASLLCHHTDDGLALLPPPNNPPRPANKPPLLFSLDLGIDFVDDGAGAEAEAAVLACVGCDGGVGSGAAAGAGAWLVSARDGTAHHCNPPQSNPIQSNPIPFIVASVSVEFGFDAHSMTYAWVAQDCRCRLELRLHHCPRDQRRIAWPMQRNLPPRPHRQTTGLKHQQHGQRVWSKLEHGNTICKYQ